MSSASDQYRQRIRALLRKHDPAMLEFVDAARGVFGPSTRLTQLELTLPTGEKLDLRKPTPEAEA
jgi:hypothetical protein